MLNELNTFYYIHGMVFFNTESRSHSHYLVPVSVDTAETTTGAEACAETYLEINTAVAPQDDTRVNGRNVRC